MLSVSLWSSASWSDYGIFSNRFKNMCTIPQHAAHPKDRMLRIQDKTRVIHRLLGTSLVALDQV